jgi:hypothetical protein
MSLYKEITKYSDYLYSIRKIKNYLSIDMMFPDKWIIPKITNNDFEVLSLKISEPGYVGISFVAQISEAGINNIVLSINEIIKFNKEKEQKEKLFRQTNEKLKAIFDGTNINKLKKLKITFEDEKIVNQEKNTEDEQTIGESETAELVREAETK